MNIFKKLFSKKQKSPEKVIEAYKKAAIEAANAIDNLAMGKCYGFNKLIRAWYNTEQEYAKYGFKPVSTDELINYVGWGGYPPVWGEKATESVKLYAWNPDEEDENVNFDVIETENSFSGTFKYNTGSRC